MNYLVADTSAVDYQSFLNFYSGVRDYYSHLPKKEQIFGRPERFFRELEPGELTQFNHILGGITNQEPLLDTRRARDTLLNTLAIRGVPVITSIQVTNISPTPDNKFELDIERAGGHRATMHSDIVINAAGWGARELGQKIGDTPGTKLLFRASRFVIVDHATQATYPDPFKVVDGMFMHYIPMADKKDVFTLQGANRFEEIWASEGVPIVVPDHWRTSLLDKRVSSRVNPNEGINLARDSFMPYLGDATPVDMVPGVVVAFDQHAHIKSQPPVGTVADVPGYLRIVPTKYINALRLGLDALHISVNNSLERGTLPRQSDYLIDILSATHVAYVK